MREILFKAKRLDNGEWVEGYYLDDSPRKMNREKIFEHHVIVPLEHVGHDQYAIDLSTLCQFTGLTDKNGVKIWEGDIVKVVSHWNDSWRERVMEVYYSECCFCPFDGDDYAPGPHDVLVIGNRFDHPHLLTQE